MTTETGGGRFRRALKKLSATPAELEADELQHEGESQGCQKIDQITDRELVRLFGHLKSVSLAPRAGTPTLEASLYDGSGVVTLVWLGRRKITGIKPGASMFVQGRVSCHDGDRVMYNPRYELRA